MVHGIALQDGKALWYRNRWIRSKRVEAETGMPHAPGPRHGGFDTVNTNVLGIAGRTWALVEAGSYPVELVETLDEQTYNPFDDTLMGSFTAHPHLDPVTGEHHAICYEATVPDEVRHVVIAARRQGDARGRDPGQARPVDPRLRDHRALCADPRPARHLLDEGADRRAQLPLSLEPRASGARRAAPARRRRRGRDLGRLPADLHLPRRQRVRHWRTAGWCSTRASTTRCSRR